MEGETEYLSKAEFAARQGWSPSYVTKLKDQGRLVYGDDGKLINVAATLALLEETQTPGVVRRAERERCARIIAYGLQHGRVNDAGALAFNSSMPAAQAIAALEALAPDRSGGRERNEKREDLGAPGPDLTLWAWKYLEVPDPDTKQQFDSMENMERKHD